MIAIDIHQLVSLLDSEVHSALERAAEQCLQRGSANVEPEDLIRALLQQRGSLLHQVHRHEQFGNHHDHEDVSGLAEPFTECQR